MNPDNCFIGKPMVAPQREPRIFDLYLDPHESGYPGISIKVSEFQLIEVIRVLSQVYFIRITD